MSNDSADSRLGGNGSSSVVANLALKSSDNEQPLIDGRFRVLSCLGRGSDGVLYLCEHIDVSNQKLVVKVLKPQGDVEGTEAAARFKNEIIAAYKVYHPNVARIYEFIHKDELLAYTMEYIEGGNLRKKLNEQGTLSAEDTARTLFQIASGVHALHAAGIIHRNLKPESILHTKEGNIKIGNFGVVRICNHSRLTAHDSLIGTLDYLSPEYIMSGALDKRLDIYAIGIVAYEMLTGKPPLHAESLTKTLFRRLNEDVTAPSTINPDCSEALSNVVLKALKRDPKERYQNLSEMIEDLRPLVPLLPTDSGIRIEETPLRLSSSKDMLDLDDQPIPSKNNGSHHASADNRPWEDPYPALKPLQSVELLALSAIVLFVGLAAWGLFGAMSRNSAELETPAAVESTESSASSEEASSTSNANAALPILKSDLRLVGLHRGDQRALAIIEDAATSKQDVFKEGDVVWEKGELVEIHSDHLIMQVDGTNYSLPKKALRKK